MEEKAGLDARKEKREKEKKREVEEEEKVRRRGTQSSYTTEAYY